LDIDKIIEHMKSSLEGFEVGSGATSEQINDIEKEFGVVLPLDYKYFLQKFGYAAWIGTCILGVCEDSEDEEYYSMPYYTREERKCSLPERFVSRPDNTVVIGPYGGGGHFFLHCANSENDGKVELLLTELNGRADSKSWKTFSEFLNHY
jgi:hypothetical protein